MSETGRVKVAFPAGQVRITTSIAVTCAACDAVIHPTWFLTRAEAERLRKEHIAEHRSGTSAAMTRR